MEYETITERSDLVIRRLVLDPGEATPWHTDSCHRFSVVVRGERLRIEFADGAAPVDVTMSPGLADWDEPTDVVHRAVNTGSGAYEEVVTFYREEPTVEPQPVHRHRVDDDRGGPVG